MQVNASKLTWLKQEKVFIKCMINDKEQVLDLETDSTYNMCEDGKEPVRKLKCMETERK